MIASSDEPGPTPLMVPNVPSTPRKQINASAPRNIAGGSRMLPEWFQRRFMARETFIRAHPPAPDGYREDDFFAGVYADD